MARELAPFDVTDDELLRAAKEVRATGQPRELRHAGQPIALLMPPTLRRGTKVRSRGRDASSESRSVRRSLAIVERTAGALKRYAQHPPLTPQEERAAFERGVAEQVGESMEG